MQSRPLEIFYMFFQGILIFQVVLFAILFLITKKRDLLHYTLFLFFAATYFFINAPYTFFGIPEDVVWNSAWYDYFNTPVIIIENLFYLMFLRSFFEDVTKDKLVSRVLNTSLWMVPLMLLLFVVLTVLDTDKQMIFYSVKLISVIPAAIVAYVILKRKPLFATLVANGLLCTIAGTCITVLMIILRNNGVHHLFTDGYPLFFIRLGLLGDMIFYLVAILQKWHTHEKEFAIEKWKSRLEVEQVRNKISGELHDDLGSTLSGISMYSYMINDLLLAGKYEEAKRSVHIIQKSAGEMVHTLNELVWTINPDQDSMQQLTSKLEEYATNMGVLKNMKVTIVVPDNLDKAMLPVETRRHVYLFCKEAINNAVKYSNATTLELRIKQMHDTLEFAVSDNGNGFDEKLIKKGNGFENMRKRAKDIGAMLTIKSKQGDGAHVAMQFKIT